MSERLISFTCVFNSVGLTLHNESKLDKGGQDAPKVDQSPREPGGVAAAIVFSPTSRTFVVYDDENYLLVFLVSIFTIFPPNDSCRKEGETVAIVLAPTGAL